MSDELLPNYRKPVGEAGREVIAKMYVGHAPMTRLLVDVLQPKKDDVALDVGCGGGLAVSLLAEKAEKVYGVDYSDISVEKAREYNRDAVHEGRVIIQQADVLGIPFPDGTFSLVTAIETVYFWDRVEECYRKIFQLLKPGGRFAILCDAWRDGDGIVNEPDRMDVLRLHLYSPDQYAASLTGAGFAKVESRVINDDRALCVIASKG
ncbi:MAG: class I SAM-dependent methyltransferase [Planctomycetaceae bacterium]|nr:class I SAM-dependent methyltransferase [Planctomycetaceae bacterium]